MVTLNQGDRMLVMSELETKTKRLNHLDLNFLKNLKKSSVCVCKTNLVKHFKNVINVTVNLKR